LRLLQSQHGIPSVVAAAYTCTALAGGGFSAQFRAGAALLVWWVVLIGIAFGIWPRTRVPGRALLAGGGLLALAALTGLSIAWTSDDGAAFTELVRASGYLGVFALVVIASPPGSARLWLSGLAIGLTAVAALALGSRIQPSLFPEQDLITLLPSVRTRLSYPLNYWNGLAACMAAAMVLLAWLGAHGLTRAGRAAAVGALPVPALALFLTSSRGGVVALAVGLIVLVAAVPDRTRVVACAALGAAGAGVLIALANAREAFVDGRTDAAGAAAQGHEMLVALVVVGALLAAVRLASDGVVQRLAVPRRIGFGLVAALGVAAVVAVAAADPARRLDEFNDPPAPPGPTRGFITRHLASAEGSGRYQFWQAGVDAFEREPVRGIGAGGYEAWWANHGSLPYFIRDAHSLFVEVAAELGLLGLAALLAFLLSAAAGGIAAGRRAARANPAAAAGLAVLGCGTASAAIDWTWELPAAFLPLVVAAAALAGPALVDRLRPAPDPAAPRFGLGVATLAIAWMAIVAAAISLVSETKLADSRAAARRGDFGDAADDARAARAVAPWSGAPDLQLALVMERDGDLRGARAAAAEAAERDPDDWRVWLAVTRLAVRSGDVGAARVALRHAKRLNPRSPLFAPAPP
jgi:hypothetical protein